LFASDLFYYDNINLPKKMVQLVDFGQVGFGQVVFWSTCRLAELSFGQVGFGQTVCDRVVGDPLVLPYSDSKIVNTICLRPAIECQFCYCHLCQYKPLNTRTVVKHNFLKIEFPIRNCHYITSYNLCRRMTN
jgi:hypothetical protein